MMVDTVFKDARAVARNKKYIQDFGEEFKRSFATWTEFELLELKAHYTKDKYSIDQIAKIHQRSFRSISSALKRLNLK